jgi:transposase
MTELKVCLSSNIKKQSIHQPCKRLSIDEFSHRKGRGRFATVVSDIEHSNLLEVINSHRQEEIIEALQDWPLEFREQIEEVSVDMWGGFPKVIEKVFPKARVVIDRFHVMKAVNEDFNQVIKQSKKRFKHLKIKHAKYLLLKNGTELDEEQAEQVDQILGCAKRLREAYELKESFRDIYQTHQTPEEARIQIQDWIHQGKIVYCDSVKKIQNHLDGICQYFINRTTSGVMEGINNKIKLIKRQAYGFTNFENLRIRLLACFS